MAKTKTVLVLADTHCGSKGGLTHPHYWARRETDEGEFVGKLQRRMWNAFRAFLEEAGKIDIAIWNGDLIDGKGERSGGTELIESDRTEQAVMASRLVSVVGADKNFFTYGTPYHTGVTEDYERLVADEHGGDIKSHQFIDINGLVLDVKHFVSGSSIPHGRHTAPARDRVANVLWSLREDSQPLADVLIRSHVHYCVDCGEPGRWRAVTTPALQAAYTKFGGRKCSMPVDFGVLLFRVENKRRFDYQALIEELPEVKVTPTKV